MRFSINPFNDKSSVMNITRRHHNTLLEIVKLFIQEIKISTSAKNVLVIDFYAKGKPILKNHHGIPYTVAKLLEDIKKNLSNFKLGNSSNHESEVTRATVYRCMIIDNLLLLDKIIMSLDFAAVNTDQSLKKRIRNFSESIHYASLPLERHNILINFGRIVMSFGIISTVYIGYYFTMNEMDEVSLGAGILALLCIMFGYSIIQTAKERRLKSVTVLNLAKKYAKIVAKGFVTVIDDSKPSVANDVKFNYQPTLDRAHPKSVLHKSLLNTPDI